MFGGPFKSKLIGVDDNYMRQLFAYIHLNPLEIEFPNWEKDINKLSSDKNDKMKFFLQSYRYSSYQDCIGINREEKSILNKNNFPNYFMEGNLFRYFIEGYLSNSTKTS